MLARPIRLAIPAVVLLLCAWLVPAPLLAQATEAQQPKAPQAVRQPVEAQPETPVPAGTPVSVTHTGDDPVGLRLAFMLKERLGRSPLFTLSSKEEKKVELRLATRVEFPGRAHLASIYAMTWVFSDGPATLAYALAQDVGLVEAGTVAEEAEALAARTDKIVSQYGYLFE
jgi:hypothetical protein